MCGISRQSALYSGCNFYTFSYSRKYYLQHVDIAIIFISYLKTRDVYLKLGTVQCLKLVVVFLEMPCFKQGRFFCKEKA